MLTRRNLQLKTKNDRCINLNTIKSQKGYSTFLIDVEIKNK